MTEAGLFDLLEAEIGIEGLDLSVLHLDEINLGALLDALGLTQKEILAIAEGTLDPSELNLDQIDPAAVLDALGLTVMEAAELGFAFAGMGHVNIRGIVSNVGHGALGGVIAGAVVILIIIILLAVIGRKKRGKAKQESATVENVPEE
jgi:hypothetical protein